MIKTKNWRMVYGCKFNVGQSLIEVIVAFAVVVVVGMALVSASLATQRNSISARNKSQATELAQQYLEQIRVIRDIKGFSGVNGYSGGLQANCWKINNSTSSDPNIWTLNQIAVGTCHTTIG